MHDEAGSAVRDIGSKLSHELTQTHYNWRNYLPKGQLTGRFYNDCAINAKGAAGHIFATLILDSRSFTSPQLPWIVSLPKDTGYLVSLVEAVPPHGGQHAADPLSHPHPPASPTPPYVPYTPRHRHAPAPSSGSSVTVSSSVQPAIAISVPPSNGVNGGGATGKLQLQNLKAAAQQMGLSNSSIGWAMLERFISEPNLGDWDHAWSLITSGKATLLLPLEQLSGNLDVSDEFIRDHVAFCNGPSTSASPLFTLSGLRGSIEGEKLTFRSTISTSSTLHATLVNPVTRPTALTSTPPLPHPLTPVVNPPYPTFSLPNHTSSLPCPPRSALIPPPLPARPNPNRAQATTSSTSSSQSTSRLNPFASLFGRTATPDPPQASSQTTPVHSPSPSIEANVKHEHLTLSVFTIDHSIRKKEVIKDISRAMKGQVKEILGSSGMGLPSWIVSRVVDFLNAFYKKQGIPIPSEDSSSGQGHSPTRDNNISRSSTSASLKSRLSQEFDIDFSSAAAIAESIQVFFGSLEDEMRHYWGATGSAFLGTRKAATQQKGDAETASLNDETSSLSGAEKKAEEKEQKLRDTMDAVERIICCLFYDKLFAPEGSDDRNHDEAVAGRVAALN
ncbi:hypothetical protein FRC02_003466, partial [Tulasnella sp. 418]